MRESSPLLEWRIRMLEIRTDELLSSMKTFKIVYCMYASKLDPIDDVIIARDRFVLIIFKNKSLRFS